VTWVILRELENLTMGKRDQTITFGPSASKVGQRFIWLEGGKRLLSLLAVGTLFLLGTVTAHGDWVIVWSDEFNGTSVDSTKWTYDIGNGCPGLCGWGNNELEYYTSRTNNAYVANGMLHIAALEEDYEGFAYTSAKLHTRGLFAKKYGRFEFRAKLPHGQGYWPALWMMPRDSVYGGWAASGEIDVMENKGNSYNVIGGTIHFGGQWPNNMSDSTSYSVPTAVTNFHVYALEWDTNSIKWFVDDVLYKTSTSWYSTGGAYPAPFNQYFFIIMNLAVGGNFGGDPDGTTVFPGEMVVDYVRVYDFVTATAPPTTPSGLIATPVGSQVALNWNLSTNATSYNVKRTSDSGGPYTTIATPPSTSYNDTGAVNCATYYYVVSGTNSLGESANSVEAATTLGSYSIAVNSGGSGASPFVADANFSGGNVSTTASAIMTADVTNPAPQAVYQSERWGASTYTIGGLTTGTSYNVRLHFAEIHFSSANSRKFNVTINSTQVLTNFDVYAASGGQNRAIVKEYTFTPNGSGQIVVAYTAGTADQPKSSGIEVILPPPTAPAGLMATAGDERVALIWNAVSGATGYNLGRATNSVGPYAAVTNGLTGTSYTDASVVNGTTYYYVVSTVQAGCESTNSTEVSVTPTPQSEFPAWQMQYFGCTGCPEAAGGADPDGDGQDNTAEFMSGTNPTNSASAFHVISITETGSDVVIEWQAGGGKTNVVQATSSPGDSYATNFLDISSPIIISGSGDVITNYPDIGGATNTPLHFYRIRLGP
jgi:beta-glucanase (GH16 family)